MFEIFLSILLIFQLNCIVFVNEFNENFVKNSEIKMLIENLSLASIIDKSELQNMQENNLDEKAKNIEFPNLYTIPVLKENFLDIDLEAETAIVLDIDSDVVLYNKNFKKTMRIASLTKLMTVLVVLEHSNLKDIVTISNNAVMAEGDFGDLSEGEKLTVENLLHIMLLESSNDAAVALAEYVSLTVDDFVILMNKKAQELGLKDTHFSCPSGLDDENNFSTAYDVAELTDYALSKNIIWDILRIQEETVSSIDGKKNHYLRNTNRLLQYSANILGGKTGFTYGAGQCLLLASQNPLSGNRIVSVVLNSDERFSESKKLIEWAFDNYIW